MNEPDTQISGSKPASQQRFLLVLLLFFHTVNTYMDRVCISSAKSEMQNDISGFTDDTQDEPDADQSEAEKKLKAEEAKERSDQLMGYVFAIFAVGYALFQIPAGWMSDRIGPRLALTLVVIVWSVFTGLTGAVYTITSLLIIRFLFGVGEAGAYPGATRALYSWLPAKERGLGQGIFHSGARVGAAFSLVVMPMVIDWIGWRWTFVANGLAGIVWGAIWWFWYRDQPRDHAATNEAEVALIEQGIHEDDSPSQKVPYIQVVTSANVLLAMFQYTASNITFFVSISWFQPYVKENWGQEAAWMSSIPLLVGAVALWVSGYLVTEMHRRGMPVLSRRIPAMVGYSIGALGLVLCTQTTSLESVWPLIICFSIAIFGVEMTLSPSWAFCMDIGGDRSGAVSGAMNMVGNLGAALSAVVFPYFVAKVTLPFYATETGTANSFFIFAASMSILAVIAWTMMNPLRELKQASKQEMQMRLAGFVGLILVVLFALIYTKFLMGG